MFDTPLVTFARSIKSALAVLHLEPLTKLGQNIYNNVLLKDTGSNFVKKRLNGRVYKLVPDLAHAEDTYEPHMIEWLERYLPNQGVFWDAGANWGFIALAAAKIVGTSGEILAIEPSDTNLAWLKRHVDMNDCHPPISILVAAVCERDGGEISFSLLADGLSPSNSLMFEANVAEADKKPQVSRQVSVPAISLDGLATRQTRMPDLVKIDVEGAELRVLQGATQLLNSDHRPIIILANHPFWHSSPMDNGQIVEMLHSAGYRILNRQGNVVENIDFDEYLCLPSSRA